MATLDVVRRVSIEAQERGLTDVTGKLQKLETQYQNVSKAGATVSASTESVERALAREVRTLDQATTAYDRFARSAKNLADARAQGRISEERHAELLGMAEQRLRRTTEATTQFAKSTTASTQATGLARHELINLSRQLQDIGVSLAGGMSPLTVLTQQGSQVADVFMSTTGSVKGFFSQMISGAGAALTRFGPLAAAVAAVGAAAYAANRVLDQQLEARQATTGGLGRFSGVAAGNVNTIAERSRTPGTSLGESREGVLALARAGVETEEVITRVNSVALRYAATTGTELKAAQQELAAAFGDLSTGADTLNKKLGFLNAETVEHVQHLVKQGKAAEAANLVLTSMSAILVKQEDATTALGRAWAAVASALEKAGNALGNFVLPAQTAQQRIEALKKELAAVEGTGGLAGFGRRAFGGGARVDPRTAGSAALQGRINDLEQMLQDEADAGARGPMVKEQIRRENEEFRLKRGREDLGMESAKTLAFGGEEAEAAAATEALTKARRAGLSVAEQQFAVESTFTKMRNEQIVAERNAVMQHEVTMMSTKAVTAAEQAAVASANAYVQARRAGAKEDQAQRVALMAYEGAMAQTVKTVEDAIRASQLQGEMMQAEANSLGMAKDARAVYLAGVKAELEMKKLFGDTQSSVAQAYIAETKAREAQNQALQRQKAALADNIRAWQQYLAEFSAVVQQLVSEGRSATLDIQGRLPQAPNSPFAGGSVEAMVQGSLGKPSDLGNIAVRDAVQESIAAQYGGKGTWQTRTGPGAAIGIRTHVDAQFIPSAEGIAYKAAQDAAARAAGQTAASTAATDPLKAQLELLRNPIGGSLVGALESAIGSLSSAVNDNADRTASNASKTDPRLDPYMSRNASIYYGTESDLFFKEMTWEELQAERLTSIGDTADEQLNVSAQQLATLQSVLASVQAQTTGLTELPSSLALSLSQEIASALMAVGLTKEAAEVTTQGQIMSLESQIAAKSATATSSNVVPISGKVASINLAPNQSGLDTMLPGTGGEQPYIFSAQPGERLRITPRGQSGEATIVNQVIHIHGVSAPERVPDTVRGLVSSATQQAQTRATLRGAA